MIIREILFVIFVATHVHENLCLATVNVNDTQENDLNFANNSKQLFDGGKVKDLKFKCMIVNKPELNLLRYREEAKRREQWK